MSTVHGVTGLWLATDAMLAGRSLDDKGEVIVDDDVIAVVALMEVALEDQYGGNKTAFFTDFLTAVRTAHDDNDDPLEAVDAWLDAILTEH